MTIQELIQKNCKENSSIEWWPRYAYHFTSIVNAISILETGKLYSRSNAAMLGVMKNDNASMQVIDVTNEEAKHAVRFYFRPLTPTQYYNEGYKHPAIRFDGDSNANGSIPIFFVFDLNKFLSLPGCTFSEVSRAGGAPQMQSGLEAFSRLNFKMIYKNGRMENPEQEKLYRQAELSQVSPMEIESCLSYILCRNEFEQSMLLLLLKEKSNMLFLHYRPLIKVCKTNMFQNNGLFIENSYYLRSKNRLSILFSDDYDRKRYAYVQMQQKGIHGLDPLNATLMINWYKTKYNKMEKVHQVFIPLAIEYLQPTNIGIQLPEIKGASGLRMSFTLENDLLGYKEFLLDEEKSVF